MQHSPVAGPEGGVLPLWLCESLCDALGRNPDAAQALARIEAARQALLGPGLLTGEPTSG